jgi:hypothetical protein
VHGQQLLQAWMSLLHTVDKAYNTVPDPACMSIKHHADFKRSLHVQLMACVGGDLLGYFRGRQQQQHPEHAECSSSSRAHPLPHPQLVSAVLGLAKQHYGQFFTHPRALAALPDDLLSSVVECVHDTQRMWHMITSQVDAASMTAHEKVIMSASAAGHAAEAARRAARADMIVAAGAAAYRRAKGSSTPSEAAASSSARSEQPYFFVEVGYDNMVDTLLSLLDDLLQESATALGEGPTARAWQEVWGSSAYGAAVGVSYHQMQQYMRARDQLEAVAQQQREQEQQLTAAGQGQSGVAVTAAGVELGPSSQQQQQQQSNPAARSTTASRAGTNAAAATPGAAAAGSSSSSAAASNAAGVQQGPTTVCVTQPLLDACCAEAGRLCQLLYASTPSRHMCNGPLCRSFRSVSESFALVRGRACVYGCCVDQAEGGKPGEVVAR